MATIKTARTPLWSRLAQTLTDDILSGRRPVGSLLPTEAELMNRFGMSRHTVRTALAELVRLGLVKRSPRRGTVVASEGRSAQFTGDFIPPSPSSSNNRVLLNVQRRICDKETAQLTGFALLTPLITLTLLTMTPNGNIASRSELWIRDSARDLMPYLTPENADSVLALLEKHAGVRCQSMRQFAEAAALDEECAALFESPAGSPGLIVTRTYFDRRPAPLVHVVETLPAGSRACETRFLRSSLPDEPAGRKTIPTD